MSWYTDASNPKNYHKVVDCQYACPAHTNVPEYLRLIAQGRYTESYLLNRESNVFPGILGRTCDRPCEPACRRGRVDGKPVAICRLKRVAADLRDDITEYPAQGAAHQARQEDRAHRCGSCVAHRGERPPADGLRSRDLRAASATGRLDALQHSFLPAARAGAGRGVQLHHRHGRRDEVWLPRRELEVGAGRRLRRGVRRQRCAEGQGARHPRPLGRRCEEPHPHRHRVAGLRALRPYRQDLSARAHHRRRQHGDGLLPHVASLGGVDTKVVARRSRQYFKASPWELDDAQEEGIEIVENHSPKRFVVENGKLVGMEFTTADGDVILPCDEVILAIGQDNAFPWIERDIGITFDQHNMPVIDKSTFESTKPGVFFGGDSAWGPANIIWAVEHGHQAAISIHQHCSGIPVSDRPPEGMHLESTKMGMHSWAYSNDFNPSPRAHMKHAELVERFSKLSAEVELGFTPEQTATEVERCLNCDIETHFESKLCIECDACVDVCPVSCLTITPGAADEGDLRKMLSAPAVNETQDLYVSDALPQTKRLMVKDEDICLHCGLCAERCPTAAWDMKKFELVLPYASAPAGAQSVTFV